MINFIYIDPEWIIHQCEVFTTNTGKVPILKCNSLALWILHENDKMNNRTINNSKNTFRGYKVIIDDTLNFTVCDIIENKENENGNN